jgi:hypothetical protein
MAKSTATGPALKVKTLFRSDRRRFNPSDIASHRLHFFNGAIENGSHVAKVSIKNELAAQSLEIFARPSLLRCCRFRASTINRRALNLEMFVCARPLRVWACRSRRGTKRPEEMPKRAGAQFPKVSDKRSPGLSAKSRGIARSRPTTGLGPITETAAPSSHQRPPPTLSMAGSGSLAMAFN